MGNTPAFTGPENRGLNELYRDKKEVENHRAETRYNREHDTQLAFLFALVFVLFSGLLARLEREACQTAERGD